MEEATTVTPAAVTPAAVTPATVVTPASREQTRFAGEHCEATPRWAGDDSPRHVPPAAAFAAGLLHHHIANTAYPIAHRRTILSYRQPARRHEALLREAFAWDRRIGLYAHIPFCRRRCRFCEYCVVPEHSLELEERYHRALMAELKRSHRRLGLDRHELLGFDIGGGTPALIDPHRISELVEWVVGRFRLAPGFAVSIETTPRIAAHHPERIAALRACGIERISMGLQLIRPSLLSRYGRDEGDPARAVAAIRRAGFSRFNIDLMYGFALQTASDVRRCVAAAVALEPEYITLYRMRYKGTQVADEAAGVTLDRAIEMYEAACEELTAAGYLAAPGKNGFSRVPGDPGTSEYLSARVVDGAPYLGVGLGAQTFTNSILAYNLGAAEKRLDRYLAAVDGGRLPIQDLYHLPPAEAMAKMIAVSFYFGQVHLTRFRERFGVELADRFPDEISFVLSRGLMVRDGERLRLTERGARSFNGVVALFYSDRVKQYLLALDNETKGGV